MGTAGAPCCPIGARTDVAEIDAALRRIGQPGAENFSAIHRRLEPTVARSTLHRHKADCLGIGAGALMDPEPAPADAPGTGLERDAPASGMAGGMAGTSRGTTQPPQPLAAPRARSPFAVPNPGDDPPTAPRKLVQAEVEARCFSLRIRGRSYAAISEEVGVDEETAIDAVERVLQRTRKGTDRKADQLRDLEAHRIDRLLDAVWERATDPQRAVEMGEEGAVGGYDPSQDKAIERATKLLERRARLLGLDTPTSGPLVQVNVLAVPGVRDFIVGIMGALEAFPDARAAVVAVARARLGGHGASPAILEAPVEVHALPEAQPGGGP